MSNLDMQRVLQANMVNSRVSLIDDKNGWENSFQEKRKQVEEKNRVKKYKWMRKRNEKMLVRVRGTEKNKKL